jgi:hypothetical protein
MTVRRGLCVAAAALAAVLVSTIAGAQAEPRLHLTTFGCSQLHLDRVKDLLQVELAMLLPETGSLPDLEVDFRCLGTSIVRVTVGDAVTQKWVIRETSFADRADPERLMALVASELFLASWLELLVRKPEDSARTAASAVHTAARAVERAASPSRHTPVLAIDLLEMARARRLSTAVPTLEAALRVGQAGLSPWQLFAVVGSETGATQRAQGRVEMTATSAGAGARWCLHFAHGELGVTGSTSVAYVRLLGTPGLPAYYGERHDGLAADLSLGFEANLTLDPLRLGAILTGGLLEPGLSGGIQGDAPVRFDGAWAGVGLFVGLQL